MKKTKKQQETTSAVTMPPVAPPFKIERKHRHTVSLSHAECSEQLERLYVREVFLRGGKYTPNLGDALYKAAEWLVHRHRFGLLISGSVGSGKTTLARAMCSLLNHMPYRLCMYEDGGILYKGSVSCGDLQDEPVAVIDEVSAVELARLAVADPDKFEYYRNSARLFIDDLGTEPSSVKRYGTELAPVAELVEWRNDKQLYTIATTNLSPRKSDGGSELAEVYGQRTESRMAELFDIIIITGRDNRKKLT